MPFTDEQLEQLEQRVESSRVKKMPKTGYLYLAAYDVIDRLNEVFRPDGWDSELLEMPELHWISNSSGQITGGFYSARVRLTVGETSHTDVGTCPLIPSRLSDTQEHEKAMDGAASTALKRAARMFGPYFGNDLYKEDVIEEINQELNANARPNANAQQPARPANANIKSNVVNMQSRTQQQPQLSTVAQSFLTRYQKAASSAEFIAIDSDVEAEKLSSAERATLKTERDKLYNAAKQRALATTKMR